MKPEELMTLLHALLSNWEDEVVGFKRGGALCPAERGVLPCGGGLPPLYGGFGSPVRGFGFPCTRVSVPLYGKNDFPARVRRES